MLVEDDYITAEIQRTKNRSRQTTKHDDMFITSYDIELEKANKDFDASTQNLVLESSNATQMHKNT